MKARKYTVDKSCGWYCTNGVGECALEMSGRGIISSGPGKPVALLYVVGSFSALGLAVWVHGSGGIRMLV